MLLLTQERVKETLCVASKLLKKNKKTLEKKHLIKWKTFFCFLFKQIQTLVKKRKSIKKNLIEIKLLVHLN